MNKPPNKSQSTLDLRQPTQLTPPPQPKFNRRLKQWSIIAPSAILITIIIATSAWLLWPHGVRDPFTANQRATLGPLYYPSKLPTGYTIDYQSISQPDPGIIVFTVKSEQGPNVYVSQQAMPQNINIDSFYRKMKQSTNLQTPIGIGQTGTIQRDGTNQKIASISTSSIRPTWILINTSLNTPDHTLQEIIQHFTLSQ